MSAVSSCPSCPSYPPQSPYPAQSISHPLQPLQPLQPPSYQSFSDRSSTSTSNLQFQHSPSPPPYYQNRSSIIQLPTYNSLYSKKKFNCDVKYKNLFVFFLAIIGIVLLVLYIQ